MLTVRHLLSACVTFIAFNAISQRGLITTPASTNVMDPNGDGYVSLDNTGFSNDGYYLDEFEIPMFALPIFGDGDTLNDTQAGPNCGSTDLTVDSEGQAAYAVLDADNNLIIRLRLADENPAVKAYTVLIDTDGDIGTADDQFNESNLGFEIDITLIKSNSQGIFVYDIAGATGCPTPVLQYDLSSNFQLSIADEVSCGDEDYFYDFFVPFGDLTAEFGITVDSELQFAVVTNISATCALGGSLSDIGGVDDNEYTGCISCAFEDLASNQCPVPFSSLMAGGDGFLSGATPTPTMEVPLKEGDNVISGTAAPTAELTVEIFDLGDNRVSTETAITNGDSIWTINLGAPLVQGDSVTAVAQISGSCDSGVTGSQLSFAVVVLNTTPMITGTGTTLTYDENDGQVPVDPGVTASDNEDLDLASATISIISGFVDTEDALTFTDQLGITGSYDAVNGILTLTGDASIDDYNIALRSVSYLNSSEDPVESIRTVEFIINDGTVDSAPFERDIDVSAINDPPVLSGTSGSTEYTTQTPPFVINGSFSITDADHTQLTTATVSVVESSTSNFVDGDDLVFVNQLGITGSYNSTTGILSLTGPASLADYAAAINSVEYEYSPPGAANENTRRITFNVSDGIDASNFINHFITFSTSTNFPPDVVDENGDPIVDGVSVTTNEDSTVEVCLMVNDPDGDLVTIDDITAASNGSISITGDLCFEYTPDPDFSGTETVTVTVCDAVGNCDVTPVDIIITIEEINDAPILAASNAEVDERITTQICIDPSDITDVEGDVHEFTSGTSPNGSTLSNGTVGDLCFDYTPPSGFVGIDQVEVTICDSSDPSVCTTSTIDIDVISVNESPIIFVNGINSSTMTINSYEDSVKVFCFSVVDLDGDNVSTLSINNLSGNGILIEDATEFCFEYTPVADEGGTSSVWEVTIQDDATVPLTSQVVVTINLAAVNDFPTLSAIVDPTAIDEDAVEQSVGLAGITAGGGESQMLNVTAVSDNPTLIANPTINYSSPDGTGSILYTPEPNQNGTATITVTVDDGQTTNNTATQTFTINVNPVNDAPTIDEVVYKVDEEVETQVCVSISDIEGDPHELVSVSSPSGNAVVVDNTGGDLCFTYTGNLDFVGQDQVDITVCDSNDGSVCSSRTITIDVLDVNEPPEIIINSLPTANYSVSTLEDTPVEFSFEVTDPEGDVVTTSGLNSMSGNGLLSEIGTFTYEFTPDENFYGTSVWEIDICDDGTPQLCGTLQVTVTVDPVNDVPVANIDTLFILRKERKSINVLANDIDIENDQLSLDLTLQENPTGGTVELLADGTISYTSDVTFRGEDKLVYKVTDNGSPSESTTGILVIRVDDNPFTVYQTVSPNGDGFNDYWHIEGIDFYPNNSVRLFDRYNNLVFEMNGYDNDGKVWTGNSNRNGNKKLPEGTYFYRITAGEAGTFGGFVVLRGTEN